VDVPAVGAGKTWNIGGKVLTPGLVEQHTHIDYGAKRLVDFEMLSEAACVGNSRLASSRSNGRSSSYCLMRRSGASL